MGFLVFLALVVIAWLAMQLFKAKRQAKEMADQHSTSEKRNADLGAEVSRLNTEVQGLSKYRAIADAEAHAQSLRNEARVELEQAKNRALDDMQKAQSVLQEAQKKVESQLALAGQEADKIISAAKTKAEEIAGDAYAAMNKAKEYQDTATAIKNIIDGYGDRYLIPTYSLLDDLAEEFGFTEAGQKLKSSRESTRVMMQAGRAATCEYAEPVRKATAIRFVIDAFNGKVDSILSRTKADNHGKLAQEIRDAYAVVNQNGAAFRNAKITEEFLSARLEELKWASTAHALRDKEREEQRALREQMREEERARKEYERAIKDAAKEEEALRKAMEKAQQQVAAANDAQRAELEAKLQDLEVKLKAAEERNQRALSMAQQTRTGHVYVISNIGSFGEHVFKIGMTRRLEPKDRIRELGDASVPFEFDVHAMIFSEDAPGLEKALHRHFIKQQLNKVNPRKEFFKVDLPSIRGELESLGIQAHWTMTALAEEYRATLQIERQMVENPGVAEAWTERQLAVEEDPAAVLADE